MKTLRYILPVVASAMLLTGCDDQKMEWGMPDDHFGVTAADIPSEVKEVLANYADIKTYAAEKHPGITIGLGVGKDIYMGDEARHALAVANFQQVTWGNAMKHDAIVTTNGSLDFAKKEDYTLDAALEALQADGLKLWGHNFFWHTQQQQTYLKSLIAPDVKIISDATTNVENVVANYDFEEGNTAGWGAWSSNGCTQQISEKGEGYESDYAIRLYNPVAGANYSAQAYYTLPDITLEAGVTYVLSFYVKADHADPDFQAELQNRTSYSAKKYFHQPIESPNTWYFFEEEFEMTQDIIDNKPSHITIDFGGGTGNVWLDNVQFGKKKEGPFNYCENGSFENGTDGWVVNNGGDGVEAVSMGGAPDGSKVLQMKASASSANAWDLEVQSPDMVTLPGKKVRMSFWIKSDQAGKGRVAFTGLKNSYPWMPWLNPSGSWSEAFETTTNWQQVDLVIFNYNDNDFADGASVWNMKFDFGYLPGVTYYLDDVQVTEVTEESAPRMAPRRGISFIAKSAEEKREALLGAMESWVKGVAEHLAGKGIVPVGYDVINEAITDGEKKVRGVDHVFGMEGDSEPTESEESGLELNWADGHFYWGYYVPDYAVKAFQLARKYLPAETKLFYNDYNLESSDEKRAAAIKFVQDIDAANGSAIVDGIGTQMHVSFSPTDDAAENATKIAELKNRIDRQFQELAATKKLVRVTELDIAIGTSSPSSAQYQAQSEAYKMVFESYFANVPEAQQSGITLWSLTDAADEHEYWLKGEVPNVWDASFKRKWAYKGVCDAVAGEDVGLQFGSDAYKAYYERQNVSDTVK